MVVADTGVDYIGDSDGVGNYLVYRGEEKREGFEAFLLLIWMHVLLAFLCLLRQVLRVYFRFVATGG